MFIGIDDTDSKKGGCTTYIAAILCENLNVLGYPKLIRLNPNIPFKTRGNGAISLEVNGDYDKVREVVLKTVKNFSQIDEKNTNPGVVFINSMDKKGEHILNKFYLKTVSQLVTIKEAEEIAEKVNAEVYKFKLGRGIIGALAAIGAKLKDKTYELLSYRIPKNYGSERKISEESVFEMNKRTYPLTFDNVDEETGQILITPHGYDPVFSGIRGENPEILERSWKMIKVFEKIERWQIFETNQATDEHLRKKKISEIKPYDCVIVKGSVSKEPSTFIGGHVIFEIKDETGRIKCAAYEPTGKFREIIRELRVDDKVKIFGGIGKYKGTINIEKIEILKLTREFKREVPKCCNRRMTSAGKGKGYKCKKCGKKVKEKEIKLKEIPRDLKLGFYEVPPRARRHLSKPLVRMN